jgi:hypothetical protein
MAMDAREQRERQRAMAVALTFVCAVACAAAVFGLSRRPRRAAPPAKDGARPPGAVTVDINRLQLHPCRIEAVSFRSQAEGWVTDACGHAFHTTDGGTSFEPLPAGDGSLALVEPSDESLTSGYIARMEWVSDRRAVAFAYDADREEAVVKITADGGATWRQRPLRVRGLGSVYASDQAGGTVWACGSDGAVIRSRDGGETFARTRRTPFDGDDSCMALSFLDDGRLGFAGGMDGTLFETSDGGETWTRLRPPRQPRPTGATTLSSRPVFDLRVTGVVRISRDEGWIAMREHTSDSGGWTFSTGDGGRSWQEAEAPIAIAARLEGGGRWGEGVVRARAVYQLVFHRGGELVRETRLVRAAAGPPVLEPLRGREPLEPGHVAAWTDHALVESFDDGRSWSTLARAPDVQRLRRVVHPARSFWALVELADGRILRGWDELSPSDQPEFDRFVMAMTEAHRRGAPTPPGPLDCLATANTGSVDLRAGTSGCEFHQEHRARLAWDGSGATLALEEGKTRRSLPVGAEARRDFALALARAVEQPDDGNHGCTTSQFADLTWRCDGAPPIHASFDESDCASAGAPPETGPAHRVQEALTRLKP